jgi:hypothetical protein
MLIYDFFKRAKLFGGDQHIGFEESEDELECDSD